MYEKLEFSEKQMNFISIVHNRFARLVTAKLSALLRSSVHVQVVSVKKMAYEDYANSISTATTIATLNMEPLNSYAVFAIDGNVNFAIIDRLCGGNGRETKAPYELMDIGTSLTEGIVVRILKDMSEAWNRVMDISPLLQQIDTNLLYTQIVPPTEEVIIVSMEIIVGDVKGMIAFCIPNVAVKSAADRFFERYTNKKNYVENNELAYKEDVLVNIVGEIKELRHTLSEFSDNFISNISGILNENKNISEKKVPEQVQNHETDVVALLSSAVKSRIEDVVELIHIYLEQDDRKKVAVFLIALGSELSVEIYKYLRLDEIEYLTFEIARLERVDCKHKTAILKEFYDYLEINQNVSTGGIEYARVLLEKSLGTEKAIDIINRLTASLQVRPFDFIRRVDPQNILNFIHQEHPQVIALVLSYLEPGKSALILENLPRELQGEMIQRIAAMGKTSPEILREIERVLEKKLSSLSGEDYCLAGGIENAVEILNFVDSTSKKLIVESINNENHELTKEIIGRFT